MGTIGWMVGCWIVSAMDADASTLAGLTGAGLLLVLAGYTWMLPQVAPPASAQHLTVRERLGLDADTERKIHVGNAARLMKMSFGE